MVSESPIEPGLQLEVVTGAHAGACLAKKTSCALVIGSAPDCDVVLSDVGVAAHHCVLVPTEQGFSARSIEGQFRTSNREPLESSFIDFHSGQPLQLLPSNVELIVSHARKKTTEPTTNQRKAPAQQTWSWTKRLAALSLTIATGIFTCLWVIASNTPIPTVSTAPLDSVQKILSELEISDAIKITTKATNGHDAHEETIILSGVLEKTINDSLKKSLNHAWLSVDWRITTVDELLERVSDVFRTNGYTSKLEYLDNGNVRVLNLDQDNVEVQRVAEHVRRDVPALSELSFSTRESTPPNTSLPIYAAMPGKRMTTIVDGDIAYVATEDGSRYFIGSVLPGGSSIRTISRDGVQVDHNGVISWIRF